MFFNSSLNTATKSDMKGLYKKQRSFADLLPWVEYLPECQQFLFNDAITRMAVFKIEPIATEGRSQAALEEISNSLASVISESFPEEDKDPWTLQIYVNSESELNSYMDDIKESIDPGLAQTEYTQEYLRVYEEHLNEITSAKSYFFDKEVTDAPWRAKRLQIRVCIYRRYWTAKPRIAPEYELEQTVEKFLTGLQAAGLKTQRADGADFYRWMLLWFNPSPKEYAHNTGEMLRNVPYPNEDESVAGRDLAEMILLNEPVADKKKGIWYFDDLPHAVVQVGKLQKKPTHGALSGEIAHGPRIYALTDRLPENAIIGMTVFILPQDKIKNRVKLIADRAIGASAESGITRREAGEVLEKQARNDKLFPMEAAVFLRGADEHELAKNIATTRALLNNIGLLSINPEKDPIQLDSFIKNLPGVQVEALDRAQRQRARLAFSTNIASLAPVYGRSRGTGTPGLKFFNRSGEPQTFDPLSNKDRRKNGHMIMLGPTGAGKSATLLACLQSMLAVHRPRLYIIEAGNSFGLFGDHCKSLGLSVHKVALTYSSDVSIPPFSDVKKLAEIPDLKLESDVAADDDDAERDILGEAELIAVLMITGGEQKEVDKLTRSNRMTIRRAIKKAAEKAANGEYESETVLPEHIAETLKELSRQPEYAESSREIREMGDAMLMFCDGLNGKLFNRDGKLWPESDVTIIDRAQAAQKGNEDTLAVAYTSLIQHINAEVEKNQRGNRYTIVLTDEAHKITTNPLLMPYVVSITKMWRKLGAWYWLATQNMKDFPDSAETLLNMIEWWLCLTMPPSEIEEIARFKPLTEEQKGMMLSATKEPGKYTEGVVMSDQLQTLFRNVPPPLSLALAQTEMHEKAARQEIMDAEGVDEISAAYKVAAQMVEKNRARAKRRE